MIHDDRMWHEFASKHENGWCKALSMLLRFNTVSGEPGPDAQRRWRTIIGQGMNYLSDHARELGFVTRRYEDRVLVIEMPGLASAPVLGFPIHLDVVPAGEGWTHNPFGGEIAQGAIWGRGAQDDKGPIIQVLYALLGAVEMARLGNRGFRRTVRIMIFSEEELGMWDDIPYYFQREAPPAFSIVPDAHFPITNGEKGFANVNVTVRWNDSENFGIASGDRANVVPAKATLTLGGGLATGINADGIAARFPSAPKPPEHSIAPDASLRVAFHGVGAHGSTPELGYSAALDAINILLADDGFGRTPAGSAMAWLEKAGRSLDGEFLGIKESHPKVGATTVNLGVLNAGGSSAQATFNIRNPIGLPCAEVLARVQASLAALTAAVPGLEATAELGEGHREPIYVDPDQFQDWIKPMMTAYKETTGREASLQSIGGTTFAKAFPNAVCFGPVDPLDGEPELAHQADEHVTLAAMRRNVLIYGRTIVGLAL